MQKLITTITLIGLFTLAACERVAVCRHYPKPTEAASPAEQERVEEAARLRHLKFERAIAREMAAEKAADRAAFAATFGFPATDAALYPSPLVTNGQPVRHVRESEARHFAVDSPFAYEVRAVGAGRAGYAGDVVTAWRWKNGPVTLAALPPAWRETAFAKNQQEALRRAYLWRH